MPVPHILYIEDNLDNQFLVNLWFRRLPYRLTLCATAEEGLQVIDKGDHADVIVLDVNLPGDLTGPQMLEKLRKMDAAKNTPVIMVSGHSTLEHVPGLNASDYQFFLPKPFKKQELLDILSKLFPENNA
jgi:CheY-like chemotaxis protein